MILTDLNRYMNAIRFKQNNGTNTWLIVGKTAAWTDDVNPPSPSPDITSVPAAFCAVKAVVKWVKEDVAGDLDYVDATGTHVMFAELQTLEDALASPVIPIVHLYAEATGAQLDVISYRAVGFATALVPAVGHTDDTFLVAANVSDWGVLETLEYHRPRTIQPAGSYSVTQLIDY